MSLNESEDLITGARAGPGKGGRRTRFFERVPLSGLCGTSRTAAAPLAPLHHQTIERKGEYMALFEVVLVPRITSGAVRLLEKETSTDPALPLTENQDWQEALEKFIRKTLGSVKYRCKLTEINNKPVKTPVIEIKLDCTLGAPEPKPLDESYRWVRRDDAKKKGDKRPLKKEGRLKPDLEVELYTDGASRGNPGPAGIGLVLLQPETGYQEEYCRYLGEATNNVAEYTALAEGLALAVERGARKIVHRTDSELLVKQLKGEYKIKADTLKMLLYRAKDIIATLESFSTTHLYREKNSRADELANRAIDGVEES